MQTIVLYSQNYAARVLLILFIPQKNSYSNQATQQNSCQIFVPQKNPGIENFKPQKIL